MSDIVRRCSRLTLEIPRVIYQASGALPAAGVYTTTAPYLLPSYGIGELTLWCTYTRGAVGGEPALRVFFGDTETADASVANSGEEGQEIVVDLTPNVSQPQDNQNIYMQTIYGPIPADGNPIVFVVPVRLPRGTNRVRITSAEVGVPATPGTLQIEISGGS